MYCRFRGAENELDLRYVLPIITTFYIILILFIQDFDVFFLDPIIIIVRYFIEKMY